ncbi:hypothetical protein AWB75_00830 [Caballeronia catudaia]|uniref:Uncharacterized protein n=1 Tax=Caballeronia catudaia TaxID=1777136 RepID=A0A157ZJM0_9BURK|nr:hypothetical protein AWB75_00830 [Caballeronia catudaia]
MIPALLETLGALSLLASVAAKIMLLRDSREDEAADAPEASTVVAHECTPCFRCGAHRERRVRSAFSARCARVAAGRAVFARTRKHG